MKAPAFDYARPSSLGEALGLLVQHGDEAKLLAGGQSLLPALNLRLQAPGLLIDLGRIESLRGISVEADHLRIGAMTRHVDVMRSPDIARHLPLVAQAMPHLSHPAIRNRGTIGGNLAQADPASELPACAVALRATMVVEGPGGARRIAADDFFLGVYETALGPDEILIAVEIPKAAEAERFAFAELARRHGDYALVGIACTARFDGDAVAECRPVFFSVGPQPVVARSAASRLAGRRLDPAAIADAQAALDSDLEPQDDLQTTAATRLHLARVILGRTLGELAGTSTTRVAA